MGAWGTDIFDNDAAADLRQLWEDQLAKGSSPEEISHALRWSKGSYKLLDEVPILIYPLVALQMEADALEDDLATEAIQMIEEDYELDEWNEPEERREKLNALLSKISEYKKKRAIERAVTDDRPLQVHSILY